MLIISEAELVSAASEITSILNVSVYQAGLRLKEMKVKLGHGEFGKWVRRYVKISVRSATNAMNFVEVIDTAHQLFGEGCRDKILLGLKRTTVYPLGARTISDDSMVDILARIDAGDLTSDKDVEDAVKAARKGGFRQDVLIERNDDGDDDADGNSVFVEDGSIVLPFRNRHGRVRMEPHEAVRFAAAFMSALAEVQTSGMGRP